MPLPTRLLPRTGQRLSVLGLGCAPLGGLFDAVGDVDAHATVHAAWDAGWRLFDTAPFYGYGLSEHRLGAALRTRSRDDWVLSTKVGRLLKPRRAETGRARPSGDAWAAPLPFEPVFDYSAAGVRRSIEDSLQRLGVAFIDLALVHDIGELTHGAEHGRHWHALTHGGGLRELQALKREGLIGAIGLGVNEWQVVLQALEHVDLDVCLLAGRYTLLEQGALAPFLTTCIERQVGVIVGGPFNSGVLAARDPAAAHFNYEVVPRAVRERVEALARVCGVHGVPLPAAALQFPLAHPAVIACIPGARSVDEVREIQRWFDTPVPAALWADLKAQALLDAQAPVPGERDAH